MTELGLTPSQTAGPYLKIGLVDGPIANELVEPSDPRAIRIMGVLLDGAGEPVVDGLVEIWQANAAGRYAHPADDREEVPLEDGFRGFGRSDTRAKLREFFEVNRYYITVAALKSLAEEGKIDAKVVADAIAKYGIDPNKPNPVTQ